MQIFLSIIEIIHNSFYSKCFDRLIVYNFYFSENNQALLRLEHLFEENETDDELSQPITITLTENFFSTFTISNIQEMSLGGNMIKSEMNRLQWQTNEDVSKNLIEIQLTINS